MDLISSVLYANMYDKEPLNVLQVFFKSNNVAYEVKSYIKPIKSSYILE